MLSARYTALTPSKWWCLQPKCDEWIYSFFRENLQEKNGTVIPMFLVAVELKPQHIGNILKTRKKRTSGKSTAGFGKFNRNPWQILVTEVEAILQPPPSARHWGFVTFATSQQALDAKVIVVQSGICMQNAWFLSANMTILPRKLGILRGNIMI